MPCTRKRISPELARLLLEDADELLADRLALLLGVGHALEPRQEAVLRLHVHERNVEVPLEGLDDLRRLVLPQQAVVDEHADELVADGLVHEQRRDRRVDAARERAEHALVADLGADPLDLLLDHRRRRPGGRRAGDVVEEVLQQIGAVRRVDDLRMELDAVEPPLRSPRRPRSEPTASLRRHARARGRSRRPSRGGSSSPPARAGGRRRARSRRHPRGRPSSRTRRRRCARPCRRGPAPSAASRNRSRASAPRARTGPGRPSAPPRRTPRPARPRGRAHAGGAPAPLQA